MRRLCPLGQDLAGGEVQPAHQQLFRRDALKERRGRRHDLPGRGGGTLQAGGAVGVLGNGPAVVIRDSGAPVVCPGLRGGQVLHIIAHGEGQLGGGQPLVHQGKGQGVRHLPDDEPRLAKGIGAGQHLPEPGCWRWDGRP